MKTINKNPSEYTALLAPAIMVQDIYLDKELRAGEAT